MGLLSRTPRLQAPEIREGLVLIEEAKRSLAATMTMPRGLNTAERQGDMNQEAIRRLDEAAALGEVMLTTLDGDGNPDKSDAAAFRSRVVMARIEVRSDKRLLG